MSKYLAIIPARGGSKRIPRKNIKDFLGKPIINYAIKAALDSKLFSDVIVSTDDREIANVAEKYGASVPALRSSEHSSDIAVIADVIEEVLKRQTATGQTYEFVCCIYATAPFVTPENLRSSFELIKNSKAETVLTVVKNSYPIQRSLLKIGSFLVLERPEYKNTRSQDLPTTFHDAGQFFWIRTSSFLKHHEIFNNKTVGYIINEFEAHDIDTFEDWEIAKKKYNLLHQHLFR